MHTYPIKANQFKTMSYAIEVREHQIDSGLSLYIPHVFPNFTREYIANIFQLIGLGRVDHVDLVAKQDKSGKMYNAAYVHFAEWFDCPATENFQERVLNPDKEARIVHDDPWYWIVLENKAKKYEVGARKPTIDLNPVTLDEIDALIAEHFNEPMDISCEFIEDTNIAKLQTAVNTHFNHANECHTKMAELQRLNDDLHDRIAELTLALQATEMELDEARQDNLEQALGLDEARHKIFILEGLVEEGLVVEEIVEEA
jgi:hypothetical protein